METLEYEHSKDSTVSFHEYTSEPLIKGLDFNFGRLDLPRNLVQGSKGMKWNNWSLKGSRILASFNGGKSRARVSRVTWKTSAESTTFLQFVLITL